MKRPHKIPVPRSARLFTEPDRPFGAGPQGKPSDACVAHIDGASRGNPGPAAYGVLIRRPDGEPLPPLRKYLGRMTNNVAEYYALIAALDYAASHGIRKLRVLSDSELLVQQVRGFYKVKSAALRPLHEQATKLARGLAYFSIEHIPRELNREADALANEALDRTGIRAGDVAPAFGKTVSSANAAGAGSLSGGVAAARSERKGEARTIRARYAQGALRPLDPLDLPEGEEVEITIHRRQGN